MEDYKLKDSGDRSEFGYGAQRDRGEDKGRFDLLPACAIARLARHFQKGAKKYSDRNWEKGMPLHMFIDSGLRHMFQYLDGDTAEDHLVAASWNFMCAMWTEEKFPELIDIPTRPEYITNQKQIDIETPKCPRCEIGDFNCAVPSPVPIRDENGFICDIDWEPEQIEVKFCPNCGRKL